MRKLMEITSKADLKDIFISNSEDIKDTVETYLSHIEKDVVTSEIIPETLGEIDLNENWKFYLIEWIVPSYEIETEIYVNHENRLIYVELCEGDNLKKQLTKACPKCGGQVFNSSVGMQSEGYVAQCFSCDEDFYGFELDDVSLTVIVGRESKDCDEYLLTDALVDSVMEACMEISVSMRNEADNMQMIANRLESNGYFARVFESEKSRQGIESEHVGMIALMNIDVANIEVVSLEGRMEKKLSKRNAVIEFNGAKNDKVKKSMELKYFYEKNVRESNDGKEEDDHQNKIRLTRKNILGIIKYAEEYPNLYKDFVLFKQNFAEDFQSNNVGCWMKVAKTSFVEYERMMSLKYAINELPNTKRMVTVWTLNGGCLAGYFENGMWKYVTGEGSIKEIDNKVIMWEEKK